MTLGLILQRRLFLGVAVLSLLAMAGAATTFATTSTHAQSSNDALCAQQDAEPDSAETAGPDTDNIDLQCGDQNAQDDSKESDDTSEQVRPESAGASAAQTGPGQ
jgi:hypothetical protein